MLRDALIPLSLAALVVTQPPLARPAETSTRAPFSVAEASISQMQQALASGRVTSRQLVTESLTRIARYNWQLNAVLAVNAAALDEADQRDRERRSGHLRGPLHGIPIAVRTTFRRQTCRRPVGRWRSKASDRRTTRRS
jgi:amidase